MGWCFPLNLFTACFKASRISKSEEASVLSEARSTSAQSEPETGARLVQANLENPREAIEIPPQLYETQQILPGPQDKLVQSSGAVDFYGDTGVGDSAPSSIVPSPRTHQDPEPANLLNVPTEILQVVAALLPPSAAMSLSYSCRALRYRIGVSHERLLGKPPTPRELSTATLGLNLPVVSIVDAKEKISVPICSRNVNLPERLELLCLLDRDGMIPTGSKICSGCASTHQSSFFSPTSLLQTNRQRLCRGMAGRIWICPHWQFDHNLITTSSNPHRSHHCGDRCVFICFNGKRPHIVWPITVLQDGEVSAPKETVDAILRSLDVPACKHLRFSNSFVSRLYSPDCNKLRWRAYGGGRGPKCNCSSCLPYLTPNGGKVDPAKDGAGECETCGTRMYFCIRAQRNGSGDVLEFEVERAIKNFRGCTDDAWLQQVSDPAECEEFEQAWYTALREGTPHIPDLFYMS